MQYVEFIALLLNKRIFWFAPRRPPGAWERRICCVGNKVDITPG